MSRRPVIIGAQTAAVALLVLIVYMTLLRPESDEPLQGISTPGPERVNVPGEERGRDRERKVDGRRHRPGGGGRRMRAEVRPTGPASVAGPPLPGAVSPAGEQYTDAVESLLSKVASAAPPSAN